MAVQTQIQTRRGTAASWTSTNPTLAAGEIGFETDTGKFKIGNGSTAWASLAYSAGSTAVTYLFNATAAQTTFSGTDANGLTLAYTVGGEQVYLNGVLLVRNSDYTATNGTSIVLTSGALVSDVLNVIAFTAMTLADAYTQAQTNSLLAAKQDITGTVVDATTATAATGIGFKGIPASAAATTGAYAIVAADAGEHIYTTATRTITIPANASVALPVGTAISFVTATGATATIAITTDTLILAGPGTTGSRTLAPFGIATAVKITSTSWIISGNGLT